MQETVLFIVFPSKSHIWELERKGGAEKPWPGMNGFNWVGHEKTYKR